MNHYWNNNVAEVGDGVVIVGSGKVYIDNIHQKQQQQQQKQQQQPSPSLLPHL